MANLQVNGKAVSGLESEGLPPKWFSKNHDTQFGDLPHIENGTLDLQTVNAAPFGCGSTLDVSPFEPLNDWIKRGGMGEF
ncbi:MAG: hypothetical protein Q8M07_14945 [Prosthecobacter sp.]|nr:hypothetical protein [Prosthecobacter sp.]